MARKVLWASLALAPLTLLVDYLLHPGDVVLFALAAAALIPLAWLIGESTEHADGGEPDFQAFTQMDVLNVVDPLAAAA